MPGWGSHPPVRVSAPPGTGHGSSPGTRTRSLLDVSETRLPLRQRTMVPNTGLEPVTSAMSRRRAYQLRQSGIGVKHGTRTHSSGVTTRCANQYASPTMWRFLSDSNR